MNNKLELLIGGAVLLIFVLVSYFLQVNLDFIEENLQLGLIGILLYIIITAFAIVFAPVSTIPLLPVAVILWGWYYAAILSIIAWTIGSIIAFVIARKYGVKFVQKFIPIDKITYYESLIPKKSLFIWIILLRMILPVDLLSYILGLFSKVSLKMYSLATFIGVIPFAFMLSYVGSLSLLYQVFSLFLGGMAFLFLYYTIIKKLRKEN